MEKCEECEGTGRIECPVDWHDGSCKDNNCPYCDGRGWVTCEECGGSGEKGNQEENDC